MKNPSPRGTRPGRSKAAGSHVAAGESSGIDRLAVSPGPARLHVEAVGELPEYLVELLDLAVRVGCGHLDPKTDLRLWHERIGSERDVDAPVEEEASDQVDVVGFPRGSSTIGSPEAFIVWRPSSAIRSSTRAVFW